MSRAVIFNRDNYEGVADHVLVRDHLKKGELGPYDILNDEGQAYVLKGGDGAEIKAQIFEGKQVNLSMFRIASFPRVRHEDDYYLTADPGCYARNASLGAIKMQEDLRLFSLLDEVQKDFSQWTLDNPKEAPEPSVMRYSHSKKGVRNLIAEIKNNFLTPWNVICNPVNEADLIDWTSYNKLIVVRPTPYCPKTQSFVVPAREYVGVLPTFGVEEIPNDQAETFWDGMVLSELIGMAVLNARGVGVLENRVR